MAELVVDFISSLDGYGAAEGWPGWWGLQGPEYQDPAEAVREMKGDDAAKSMRTVGSLTLCRCLLNAGLADRFRVVVFPVITGSSGRGRIYDDYPDVALDMINSRTFDGRIQLLEYEPRVLAGPPGRPA